jgi:hypothetical protein
MRQEWYNRQFEGSMVPDHACRYIKIHVYHTTNDALLQEPENGAVHTCAYLHISYVGYAAT